MKYSLIILLLTTSAVYSQDIGGFWTEPLREGLINIVWTVHGDEGNVHQYIVRREGRRIHVRPANSSLSSGYQVIDFPPEKQTEYSLIMVYKSGIGIVKAKSKYPYNGTVKRKYIYNQ